MLPEPITRNRPATRITVDSGNRSNVIFLTVCTKFGKPILANRFAYSALVRAWRLADHWAVGRFVIMPNHIHLFCSPTFSASSLRSWVRFWKSMASKSWYNPDDHPLWLPNMWDTQLRHGDSYNAKWKYVMNNPVRHGLVKTAEEWPYRGRLNLLAWHDP